MSLIVTSIEICGHKFPVRSTVILPDDRFILRNEKTGEETLIVTGEDLLKKVEEKKDATT